MTLNYLYTTVFCSCWDPCELTMSLLKLRVVFKYFWIDDIDILFVEITDIICLVKYLFDYIDVNVTHVTWENYVFLMSQK